MYEWFKWILLEHRTLTAHTTIRANSAAALHCHNSILSTDCYDFLITVYRSFRNFLKQFQSVKRLSFKKYFLNKYFKLKLNIRVKFLKLVGFAVFVTSLSAIQWPFNKLMFLNSCHEILIQKIRVNKRMSLNICI